MHDPLVYYLLWILAPVVPAYAMFKWLPSDASATGPFGGMKWKLGGAFSGYFLIVLISLQPISKAADATMAEQKAASDAALASQKAQSDAALAEGKAKLEATQKDLGERWTISGRIRRPDGNIPFDAKFRMEPPILQIRENGTFSVEVLLPQRKTGDTFPPDLLISSDTFVTVGIALPWDEETRRKLPPAKYNAVRDPATSAITITPDIVLEPDPAGDNKP